jgi:hypothetical protein
VALWGLISQADARQVDSHHDALHRGEARHGAAHSSRGGAVENGAIGLGMAQAWMAQE